MPLDIACFYFLIIHLPADFLSASCRSRRIVIHIFFERTRVPIDRLLFYSIPAQEFSFPKTHFHLIERFSHSQVYF